MTLPVSSGLSGVREMSLDIVSYLMGKAAGGGGSGGAKTLLTSDWLRSYGGNVEADGNTISFLSGGTSHDVQIAPPASIDGQNKFRYGNSFVIAFEIKEVKYRINFYIGSVGGSDRVHLKNNLLTVMNNGNAYATTVGKEVLTWDGPVNGTLSSGLTITAVNSSGSSASTATGLVEVTGIAYAGKTIFGEI